MRKDKMYKLLAGFVDDELLPDKRCKVIKEMENNSHWNKEYEDMKEIKKSLNSLSHNYALSPSFEANLSAKIHSIKTEQNWFVKLLDKGVLNKTFYGMVTASALFLAFVGAKVYINDVNNDHVVDSDNISAVQTANRLGEYASFFSNTGELPGIEGVKYVYDSKKNYLTIISDDKQNKPIKIDLRKWKSSKMIER